MNTSRLPPPLPTSGRKPDNRPWIAVVLVLVLVVSIAAVGLVAAILIPTIGKVRETARRTVDASNLRQIAHASLQYAMDHGGSLPLRRPPLEPGGPVDDASVTIHAIAAALARDGGLNDSSVWFATSDSHAIARAKPILLPDGTLDPEFAASTAFSLDYVTGVQISMPGTTPIAWTRGLRRDGTWDAQGGIYGSDGGYVVYLGGAVTFHRDLSSALMTPDHRMTSDILEVLPPGTRVVGAGPGTLHGSEGSRP